MIIRVSIKLKKPYTSELLSSVGDAIHAISDILEVHNEMPFSEPDETILLTGMKTGLEMKIEIAPSETEDRYIIELSNLLAKKSTDLL